METCQKMQKKRHFKISLYAALNNINTKQSLNRRNQSLSYIESYQTGNVYDLDNCLVHIIFTRSTLKTYINTNYRVLKDNLFSFIFMKTHLQHRFLSLRQDIHPYSYDLRWPFTTHARSLLLRKKYLPTRSSDNFN